MEERLAEYNKKNTCKAKPVAKLIVCTELEKREKVKAIERDTLVYGTSKLVTIGFGMKRL